jgi:hypothetical protein
MTTPEIQTPPDQGKDKANLLNAARYLSKIRMSTFITVLGIIAILTGTAELLGVDLSGLAILLFLLGAYLIVKPWFDKRQLFGKAEER